MSVGGLTADFTFDPDTHTYRHKGVVYPGVTTVIESLIDYSMVSEERLRLAAERGSAVHLATELDDNNDLDEGSLDPALVPYLDAWRQFRYEHGFKAAAIERPLLHLSQGYCCTLDRAGHFPDGYGSLVEIKTTSTLMPATGPQLVGQKLAWEANGGFRIDRRFAVKLGSNGRYKLQPYPDPDDLPAFMACLTRRRWLQKHNQLNRGRSAA